MDVFSQTVTVVFGFAVLAAAARLFKGPFRWAVRMALNTALGFVALAALNIFASGFPVPGITLFNTLTVGVLGLPGLAVLMLVRYIF